MHWYVGDQGPLECITEEIRTVTIVEISPLGNLGLFREQNDLKVQIWPDSLWRNPSIGLFKGYLQFGWKIDSKLLTCLCHCAIPGSSMWF